MSIEARFEINKGDFKLDVDLNIPATGVTSLLGPSGCGKTTLLRAIAGLEKSQAGYLNVAGDIWQNADQFVPPHKRPLGYVFQESSLFAHINVRSNIEYGYRRLAEPERKISLDKAIELSGVGHLLERKPGTLSGGERQRVAIARALAVSPGILLMDEPLAALDAARKQEILPYLESMHDELDIPIIYVSHSTDEVARLADHLVLLDKGKVIAFGATAEMLTRLDLPLARGADAEALIEAVVAGHDDEYSLTYLDFPGGRFTVTQKPLEIGKTVRLRVVARDVSLTLEHQADTSILNIFPVIIDELIPVGSSQLTVRLLANDVPLLSKVTRKSAALLGLETGKKVYAQAKSVALLA
ncbi:MAG: molybdenum ABC transporter ATP-binding protein [Gammaproteobacteria bacterium]|nr:molybdenum ABC transporter ATP-binding protein [Gammaproteobacteria bacterium]